MRLRFRKRRSNGHRELLVRPTRGEALDGALARRAMALGEPVLLSMVCEGGGVSSRPACVYDVEGLVSLRGIWRREGASYVRLSDALVGVARAVRAVADLGLAPTHLLFDARYVFVDASSSLRFACLPLSGMAFDARNTPLALLGEACAERHLRNRPADERVLAERLREFVAGEEGAFSANEFFRFVADETGVCVRSDAARDKGRAPVERPGYVLRDLSTGRTYGMCEGERLRLGRGSECEVRIRGSGKVSREHASVRVEGGDVLARDLGSTNGTEVAGRRVPASCDVRVVPGQVLSLSGRSFRVEENREDVVR